MIENFRPTQGNVLFKLIKEELQTSGGLYMPDSSVKSDLLKGVPLFGLELTDQVSIKCCYFPKLVGYKIDEDHIVIASKDILGCEVDLV